MIGGVEMELQDAIAHAKQVAEGCPAESACAYQHDKLVDWLEELAQYRNLGLKPGELKERMAEADIEKQALRNAANGYKSLSESLERQLDEERKQSSLLAQYGDQKFASGMDDLKEIERLRLEVAKYKVAEEEGRVVPWAKWDERHVNVGSPKTDFFCTNCSWPALDRKTNHCPNCGAKFRRMAQNLKK